MTDDFKLNPCPFCGAIPTYFGDDVAGVIRCMNCSVTTGTFRKDKYRRQHHGNAEKKAVEFWNNVYFNWNRRAAS